MAAGLQPGPLKLSANNSPVKLNHTIKVKEGITILLFMALLLIYLSTSLVFSFLCSLLEASLLSITPSYVSVTNEQNPKLGKTLSEFKDNIDRPLAAILTLNTFAHTIGAAGVGAQAQILWGDEVLTIVSVILTIVILILTEIIPKTLGANYWRELTPFTIATLKILIYSPLYPIILFSQFITKRLKKDKVESVLSRADFTAMAKIVETEGVLHKDESRVINNMLGFRNLKTREIMTPRTVLKAAPENISIIELYNKLTDNGFSRIPVYVENIDRISGYVLKVDVMDNIVQGNGEKPLTSIKRNIQIIHEHTPLSDLFPLLISQKEHLALVTDEYGGTAGLVTMEDVIETLLGLEILDETDNITDLRKWALQKWQKRSGNQNIAENKNDRPE